MRTTASIAPSTVKVSAWPGRAASVRPAATSATSKPRAHIFCASGSSVFVRIITRAPFLRASLLVVREYGRGRWWIHWEKGGLSRWTLERLLLGRKSEGGEGEGL